MTAPISAQNISYIFSNYSQTHSYCKDIPCFFNGLNVKTWYKLYTQLAGNRDLGENQNKCD